MKALAAILLAVSFSASAQTSLVINGLSYHADRSTSYNERNAGLGISSQLSDVITAEAGFYNNSYHKTTAYVIASYQPVTVFGIKAGMFGGLATGYKAQTGYSLSPVAGLAFTAPVGRVDLHVRWVPPVPNNEKPTSVTTFSAGIKF